MIYIYNTQITLKINKTIIKTKGKLKESIIYFKHENINYEFDLTKLIFIRESNDFISKMEFNKNDKNNYYLLKSVNEKIIHNLVIKELQLLKNIVIIRYEIEGQEFNFKLSYKKVN